LSVVELCAADTNVSLANNDLERDQREMYVINKP